MRPGKRNSITDVSGLHVGHASNEKLKSGVTVLTSSEPFVAGVQVMGGSPGTRETDLLDPDKMVEKVDALVLSGGSALGLDAAGGVANLLCEQGRGFKVGSAVVPIVPAAILFDLHNGGTRDSKVNPYSELGREALSRAGTDFLEGSEGAGTGATTAGLKGGLGSASLILPSGVTVAALMVVNSVGSVIHQNTGQFWAAPFEIGLEFGGLGVCSSFDALAPVSRKQLVELNAKANTTIGIVATNARLSKSQAKRLAVSAHDGIARAMLPSHSPFDGDLIFSVSTGELELDNSVEDLFLLGHAASVCVSRAIARGVYEATPAQHDVLPVWRDLWGK